MYTLTNSTKDRRTYTSQHTNTQVETYLLYTSQDGREWWAFIDLLSIPYIRQAAADRVTKLYGAGITQDDINKFVSAQKATLKSNDPEKYEKAYAAVMEFESLSTNAADPVRQLLSLCSVYILSDDEQIDVFNQNHAAEKMSIWSLLPDAAAFFLSWLTDGIQRSSQHFTRLSQIASRK